MQNATKNIAKHASIIACVAGSTKAFLDYRENKSKDSKVAQHALLQGALTGLKEGVKFIATKQIKSLLPHNNIHKAPIKCSLHIAKKCSYTALHIGAQTAMQSANDIIKWQKREINHKECLRSIKTNACGVVGSMLVARGCIVIGGVIAPGIGVLAGGIAGMYIGEYLGKKIANKIP